MKAQRAITIDAWATSRTDAIHCYMGMISGSCNPRLLTCRIIANDDCTMTFRPLPAKAPIALLRDAKPLQAMLADVAKTPGEENPQHVSYPPNLWEPYRTRRFANGEDLYASIGVPREDKAGRLKQLAKNAQFFGAPVGVIMFTEERMGPVQWIDLGIYLQAFMLRATEEGLATCAQGFWRRYDAVVKQHLAVPEGYLVAFGIALGYEDTTAPINTMRASRAEFAEWGQLQGF